MKIERIELGDLALSGGMVDGPFGSDLKASEYVASGVPIIRLQNIKPGLFIQKEIQFVSENKAKELSRHNYQPGDLVIAKLGDPCGVAAVVPKSTSPGIIVADVVRFRGDPSRVDHFFISYFLNSPAGRRQIDAMAKGTTRQRCNLSDLKSIKIDLPPIEEQKRIAAILNKADSLLRKRQQAIRLAEDFLRASFLDMFGDPVTNPKGWQVVKLGELAKSDRYAIKAGPFGSALKKECYVSSGYRIYGQEQVIRDDLTFGDYYINEDKYRELESCKVESGDMLISLVGTFGKICIVPPEFEPGIINPRLMKVSFDPLKATPRFMKALLTSDSMVRKIESLSHGGTMGIVNVGIMKELEIPVPPVAIQIRFEEVQQKLATLKANYHAAEEQTTSAFSALQSQYFS